MIIAGLDPAIQPILDARIITFVIPLSASGALAARGTAASSGFFVIQRIARPRSSKQHWKHALAHSVDSPVIARSTRRR
jgi:hypothetical protein